MIFPWIWNSIPGPAWARTLLLVAIGAVTVWALFEYVFPWISVSFGIQEQNLEE